MSPRCYSVPLHRKYISSGRSGRAGVKYESILQLGLGTHQIHKESEQGLIQLGVERSNYTGHKIKPNYIGLICKFANISSIIRQKVTIALHITNGDSH